jgi:hypothetical protein
VLKRNTVHSFILPVVALAAVFLSATAVNAQKGSQSTTGAPLKGVDVKLGKNPGGSPAARVTTDGDGNFAFPVVPAGEYMLTLELKKDTPDARAARSSSASTDSTVRFCYITLTLPGGEKVEKGYDLAQNKAFDPAIDPNKQLTSKIKLGAFIVRSDGATPLNGTIKKSRSNINNN